MNFDHWVGSRRRIDTRSRAARAWARIQDRPAVVSIVRNADTTLAAQTVRIEPSDQRTIREVTGGAGTSGRQTIVVFGVRDHESVADTNIDRDDTFQHGNKFYRVVQINLFPGEVQALAEAQS